MSSYELSPLESNLGYSPQLHEVFAGGRRTPPSAESGVKEIHRRIARAGPVTKPCTVRSNLWRTREQSRLRPPQNSQTEKSPRQAPPKGKPYRRKVARVRAAGWSTACEHQGHPAGDL